MDSCIIKLMSKDRHIRIHILDNTALIRELIGERVIDPISKEAFITAFSISGLLCGLLKDDQRMSVHMGTSSPLKYVRCDIDSSGNVRGYGSGEFFSGNDGVLSISGLIGDKGHIRIVKDIGMGSVFTGIVDMPRKDIVGDFEHYFNQSEQIRTSIRHYLIGNGNSEIGLSRSVLLQPMPFAPPGLLMEWSDRIDGMKEGMEQLPIEGVLGQVFTDAVIVGTQPIRLHCGCSKGMLLGMLRSLGKKELQEVGISRQMIEMFCTICGRTYRFDGDDIKTLLEKDGG